MPTLVLDLPAALYEQLKAQARQTGMTPEALSRDLLETALHVCEEPQPRTSREVLQAAGRVRPMSDAMRAYIIH